MDASKSTANGNHMRAARLKAGLSMEQVSRALEISAATVRRWEIGQNKPDYESVVRFARIVNSKPEDLVRVA